MKAARRLQIVACTLSCLGMIVPWNVVMAQAPGGGRSTPVPIANTPPPDKEVTEQVNDIALRPGGILIGRIVDAQNAGVPHVEVIVKKNDTDVAKTQTDAEGFFRVEGLGGGNHQVIAGFAMQSYRFWANGAAPPSAAQSVWLVSDKEVYAAQYSPLKWWLADPLIMAAIATIAIAVPIIIHNNREDRNHNS